MEKEKVEIGEIGDGKKLVLAVETPIGINTSQLAQAADGLKMLYDSLINAGFREDIAIKLTIAMVLK